MTVPLVEQAHSIVASVVRHGDIVVDATMGNGFDTLFLSEQVGASGMVYAFDIQVSAINKTRLLLDGKGVLERVRLIHDDHANMVQYLSSDGATSIRCAMFNLGYLPGSDKGLQTTPESTLNALNAALKHLKSSGVISILAYTGHSGGREEAEAIKLWAKALPTANYQVDINVPARVKNSPPELISIRKL